MKIESKWNSKGGGMSKHRKSGVSHNHAITISKVREHNKDQEKIKEIEKKKKSKMFTSVEEAFNN